MTEGQPERVQRLPGALNRPQRGRPEHVPLLAHERVSAQPRLNSDLIALAGDQPDFDERRVLERLENSVLAHGFLAVWITRMGLLLNERSPIPHELIAPGTGRRNRV